MRRNASVALTVTVALAVVAAFSLWPLSRAWTPQNPDLHAMILFVWLLEFALIVTALNIGLRAMRGHEVTALYVLATFFAAAFVSAAMGLVLVSLAIAAVLVLPILAALVLTFTGRYLISAERVISGTGLVLIPVLLIAIVALIRPFAPGAPIWTMLAIADLTLAAALVTAACLSLRRSHQTGPHTTRPVAG